MCWLCDAEAQGFYGSDLWNGAQLRGSAEAQDVSYVAFSYLLYNESSRQFIVKNGETELVGGQTVTDRCVELIFEKVSVRKTDRSSEEFTSFRGVLNFLFFCFGGGEATARLRFGFSGKMWQKVVIPKLHIQSNVPSDTHSYQNEPAEWEGNKYIVL